MPRFAIRCALFFLLVFASGGIVHAADDGKGFVAQEVRIDDRFEKDTRADYRVVGETDWDLLKVSLKPGSALGVVRTISADFDLGFELWPEPVPAGQPSVTRVELTLTNRWRVVIAIARAEQSGAVHHQVVVADIDGRDASKKPITTTRRRSPVFRVAGGVERWAIRYRHGVIRVSCGGREVAAAYSEAFSSWPQAVMIAQVSGEVSLSRLTLTGETEGYSARERELYEKTLAARKRATESSREGDLAAAVASLEEAIALGAEAFGEGDFSIALHRAELAGIYETGGDRLKAIEQLSPRATSSETPLAPSTPRSCCTRPSWPSSRPTRAGSRSRSR